MVRPMVSLGELSLVSAPWATKENLQTSCIVDRAAATKSGAVIIEAKENKAGLPP